MRIYFILAFLFIAICQSACGDLVRVHQMADVGGTIYTLSDSYIKTGSEQHTVLPPEYSGYKFTGWKILQNQDFMPRDSYGRAYESPMYHVYEATTLIAVYVESYKDEDEDRVSDCHELYWYGTTEYGAMYDSDSDGIPLKDEIYSSRNPHFADGQIEGDFAYAMGAVVEYNPTGLRRCIIRSEPEGVLLTTTSKIMDVDTVITTPSFDPRTSNFAYWTLNGVRMSDANGRALDAISLKMPNSDVELVAVCIENYYEKWMRYWSDGQISLDSDSDGDGISFRDEISRGLNPLFFDGALEGAFAYGCGDKKLY